MPPSRFVDLSHPVVSGEMAYPGLPAPLVEAHLTREASRANYQGNAEFEISRVDLVGNSGTYLDSPFHRFAGRPDLADLPLEAGILIVEHLRGLDRLPETGFRFRAVRHRSAAGPRLRSAPSPSFPATETRQA